MFVLIIVLVRYFVNTALASILSEQITGGQLWVWCYLIIDWKIEAILPIKYTLGLLYFFGTELTVKCLDPRDKLGIVS